MKCKQCGFCCQNFTLPPVTEMRNQRAARAMLQAFDFPLLDYIDGPVSVKVGLVITNSPCRFYNPLTHLCRDYLGRPDLCREYYCKKCIEEDITRTDGEQSEIVCPDGK